MLINDLSCRISVLHTSGVLWWFVRFQDEGRDMASSAFALASIFDGVPAHIAQVPHLHGSRSLEHHQHPLVDGIDHHGQLAFLLFFDGFPHPCSWAFLPALMDDGSEWRIHPVPLSPFARQPVKVVRLRAWARVEVELELGVDYTVDEELGIFTYLEEQTASTTITFDVAASTREVTISTDIQIEGEMKFVAMNPDGPRRDIIIPRVRLAPNGDFQLVNDPDSPAFQQMPLTISALQRGTKPLAIVEGRPFTI